MKARELQPSILNISTNRNLGAVRYCVVTGMKEGRWQAIYFHKVDAVV